MFSIPGDPALHNEERFSPKTCTRIIPVSLQLYKYEGLVLVHSLHLTLSHTNWHIRNSCQPLILLHRHDTSPYLRRIFYPYLNVCYKGITEHNLPTNNFATCKSCCKLCSTWSLNSRSTPLLDQCTHSNRTPILLNLKNASSGLLS